MYCVLTGGSLVLFRVKGSVSLQTRRRVYPLFGAYVFSGRLALEQLDANNNETLFNPKARIYSDGLQTTDGVEDTTFCIKLTWPTGRLAPAQPWDQDDDSDDNGVDIKHTDKKNQDRDGKDDDKKDKDKGKKGSKQKSFTAPRLNGNPLMLFFRARSQVSLAANFSIPFSLTSLTPARTRQMGLGDQLRDGALRAQPRPRGPDPA